MHDNLHLCMQTLSKIRQRIDIVKTERKKTQIADSSTMLFLAASRTRDMIPNTKFREMVGTKSSHHHIQQQRIKWFEHLTILPIYHPAQCAYNTRFSGHKARGHPRKTWIARVKETLSLYNIPPAQAFWRAADKRFFLPTTPQVAQAVHKNKSIKNKHGLNCFSVLALLCVRFYLHHTTDTYWDTAYYLHQLHPEPPWALAVLSP